MQGGKLRSKLLPSVMPLFLISYLSSDYCCLLSLFTFIIFLFAEAGDVPTFDEEGVAERVNQKARDSRHPHAKSAREQLANPATARRGLRQSQPRQRPVTASATPRQRPSSQQPRQPASSPEVEEIVNLSFDDEEIRSPPTKTPRVSPVDDPNVVPAGQIQCFYCSQRWGVDNSVPQRAERERSQHMIAVHQKETVDAQEGQV